MPANPTSLPTRPQTTRIFVQLIAEFAKYLDDLKLETGLKQWGSRANSHLANPA
jgi:hypothetical protein